MLATYISVWDTWGESVGDWAQARNWHNCYVTTGLKNRSKNRHVMCCEPGGVRFFVVFPREFVTEIKLMWYCEILLWNLEASRQTLVNVTGLSVIFWNILLLCRASVLIRSFFIINFRQAASDATQIFEETKHSVEAREMMQAFFVGIFVEVSRINLTLTFSHFFMLSISVFPNECNIQCS